jgi:hypothetical protein
MSDEHKPEPPDLDLIQMVQRGRMAHDAEAAPSQVSAVYWIEAKRAAEGKPPTPRAGYWAIATTLREVDAVWAAIKAATEAGQLGYKSKVATASHSGDPNARTIHVMTYDADDTEDVARVRAALAALDMPAEIEYHR